MTPAVLFRRLQVAFRKPNWLRLDNAAKIYPAARRRNWSNVFRVAATMKDEINPEILASALEVTAARFPSIAVRLRRGVFWYYLEEIDSVPPVRHDTPFPCRRMTRKEARVCAFRVLYYKNRIAAEFFHALTDGSGAMVFLKTLVAEYAEQRYGITVPAECGILSRKEEPSPEEIEDSFLRYEGNVAASRKEEPAYHIKGEKEPDGYLNITTGIIDVDQIMAQTKRYNATLTNYLAALMVMCVADIQRENTKNPAKQKPVKVLVPVNLRKHFPSKTVRNFAMYVNVGIDPRMGEYTMKETIEAIRHQMGLKITKKELQASFTANVRPEKSIFLKIVPLTIKNLVMKAVYNSVGERFSCMNISNLGNQELPEVLSEYVESLEFVLGILADTAYNCSAISYKGKLRFTFTSNLRNRDLERKFFTALVKSGVHVKIENTEKEEADD